MNKSLLMFLKINKQHNSGHAYEEEKREDPNNKIRCEKGEITTDTAEIHQASLVAQTVKNLPAM